MPYYAYTVMREGQTFRIPDFPSLNLQYPFADEFGKFDSDLQRRRAEFINTMLGGAIKLELARLTEQRQELPLPKLDRSPASTHYFYQFDLSEYLRILFINQVWRTKAAEDMKRLHHGLGIWLQRMGEEATGVQTMTYARALNNDPAKFTLVALQVIANFDRVFSVEEVMMLYDECYVHLVLSSLQPS